MPPTKNPQLPAPQVAPPDPARAAARVMFDALTKISRANAFFDGEKQLKNVAVRALEEVERLSKELPR